MDYPSKKEFVGSVKIREVNPNFAYQQVTFSKDDLKKMSQYLEKWTDSEGEERETMKVQIKKSQKGTYYAEIDTWKPEKKKQDSGVDDLPF